MKTKSNPRWDGINGITRKLLLPLFVVVCLVGNTSTGAITVITRSGLGNISTRGFVGTNANILDAGFIIKGTGPKTVIIRAIGPELAQSPFNVPNTLANPQLQLFDVNRNVLASNDNWQTTVTGGLITSDQVSAIQNSGLAPGDPRESAIIVTLQPGAYTTIVSGVNNTQGVALVEVYDLSLGAPALLGNISTRGFVGTGADILDGGFIVQGTQPKTVIIRAIGPELAQSPFNVPNTLANPQLQLFDVNRNVLASNDNWQTTVTGGLITSDQVSAIQNSGLAPGDPRESAIIVTLQPGAYTTIVSGVNNTQGVALVEVYYLETAPLPMTPLNVATTGIDSTSPVSVSFFNNAGFSVSYQAIRAEADGSVVVAVPFYMDPVSTQPAAGTVSMILTQGSNSSPPVSLDIQNLPTLDTYGTQLGQISHAVLVYEANLLGRRLNQLQAFQVLPGNTVDTSQAQATLKSQLNAVIQARSDVDRVMIDNSVVIANGSLPDGTAIQFDKGSLDIMDRMNALFLTQAIVPVVSGSALSSSQTFLVSGSALSSSQTGMTASNQTLSVTSKASFSLIDSLPLISGMNQIETAALNVATAKSWTDIGQAVGTGLGGALAFFETEGKHPAITKESSFLLGVPAAVLGDADIITSVFADDTTYLFAYATGNQSLLNASYDAMQSQDQAQIYRAALDVTLAMYGSSGIAALETISTVGGFILSYYDLGEAALAEPATTIKAIDLQYPMPAASNTQGIAQITDTVNISNSQGIAAAQTSLDLCCMNSSDIQGICDPSGECDLFTPLGVPNTTYNNLTLTAFDYITGISSPLASETVDLSGLNTSQPVQVPTMVGTCNDTDAGTPDADDPDCD